MIGLPKYNNPKQKRKKTKPVIPPDAPVTVLPCVTLPGAESARFNARMIMSALHEQKLKDFYDSAEWAEVRKKVYKKHKHECSYCGYDGKYNPLHVDHIRPLRLYWDLRLNFDNLQLLCSNCNSEKGNLGIEYHNHMIENRKKELGITTSSTEFPPDEGPSDLFDFGD